MKTVLLSTSSLWNCGDDFIREGVLELVKFKPDVRIIWWNRGYGISCRYANDLKINLPLIDYFIMAGTPQWIFRNEVIYDYCLKMGIPISIIGVGTRGIANNAHYKLMKRVANSGLCEISTARDEAALESLKELGFKNTELMLDPAFFMQSLDMKEKINILGWRYQFGYDHDPYLLRMEPLKFFRMQQIRWSKRKERKLLREEYNKYMLRIFDSMAEPKLIVIHDNREIEKAESIFGKQYVFYSSDYREIFRIYSTTKIYFGSRLHGSIPAIIHGGSVHLIYADPRWNCMKTAISILSKHIEDINKKIKVTLIGKDILDDFTNGLEPLNKDKIQKAIKKEKDKIRSLLKNQKLLSSLIVDT
ncbi:MAG: polysaccharide pyruvyl transferase family protein [Candidatus Hodarchaeota archaeon]